VPYYRGTHVPDCFTRWDAGDPECDVCQVEALCCQAQEDKVRKSGGSSSSSSQSTKTQNETRTTSTSMTVHLPPDSHVLPKEGESAVSRLGKNIVAGCLKETGVQMAIFFSKWKFP
jgi:hypothetical protein